MAVEGLGFLFYAFRGFRVFGVWGLGFRAWSSDDSRCLC